MIKRALLLMTMALVCLISLHGQQNKSYEPNNYYYNQARQCLDNNDFATAYDYLNKELTQNPDNGYAHYWKGVVEMMYCRNLTGSIISLDVAVKILPKKDKDYLSSAYACRSLAYQYLGDTISAFNDINQAIRLMPQDDRRYVARGNLFHAAGEIVQAMKDYQTALSINANNVEAQLGVGKMYYIASAHKECLAWLGRCIAQNPDKSDFYALRALCYQDMEDYANEAKDVVKALSMDNNSLAIEQMHDLAEKAYNQINAELRIQQIADPDNPLWTYYLGNVNEDAGKYEKALFLYKEIYDKYGEESILAERIAGCWSELGDYEMAADFQEEAVELADAEEDNPSLYYALADYYESIGEYDDALESIDMFIDAYSKSFVGYGKRAWIKKYAGHPVKEVIEDYDLSIALEPEYAYNYCMRGMLYKSIGKTAEARADFNKTIELARDAESYDDYSAAAYSYLGLGNVSAAKNMIQKALDLNEKEASYDAACLYSLMNETEKALKYLQFALQSGYRNFFHISRDTDLDNIRKLPQFTSLVREYEIKMDEELDRIDKEYFDSENASSKNAGKVYTQEIPYRKVGGVYEVPCTVNGLPLKFIFDTGAADVTISSVEAVFMLKNGYLTSRDVLGSRNYLTANGDVVEGTMLKLRSVKIGDAELENVRASVVHNQNAPLLLGQSALEKLGKFEFDNRTRVLRVFWMRSE